MGGKYNVEFSFVGSLKRTVIHQVLLAGILAVSVVPAYSERTGGEYYQTSPPVSESLLASEASGVKAAADRTANGGFAGLETLTLEELLDITIGSTSLFNLSISRAPGAIQVFRLDDLKLGNVFNLSDLLEHYAVGSTIGNHNRHGALHGVRGILIDNSAKTLLMIDGQHINPRSHFGASLALNSPFIGDFERVEVVNGPGAILHGSGAINGFINLIPKTGTTYPGNSLSFTYAEPGEYKKLEGSSGFSYGYGRDLFIYAGVLRSEGYPATEGWGESESNYAGYDTNAWRDDNYKLSTVWNHGKFNLQAFFTELNSPTNFSNAQEPFHSASLGIRPKLLQKLTETESIEINVNLFWHEHRRQKDATMGELDGGAREHHWDNKLVFRTERSETHQIAFGIRFGSMNFDQAKQYFQDDPPDNFESVDTHWDEYSFFAEDIWNPSDRLTISTGLRLDKINYSPIETWLATYTPDNSEGHYSPRVALAYALSEAHNIKLSYQHGFRNPDATYYNFVTVTNFAAQALGFSTVDLKPETTDSYELNYTWQVNDDISLGCNLYYNEYKDQLSWGPLTNLWSSAEITAIMAFYDGEIDWMDGQFQNIAGEIRTQGGELIMKWNPVHNISVDASYGYVELGGYQIVERYPEHQAKVNMVSTFVGNKLTLGASYLFSSGFTEASTPGLHDIYKKDRHLVDLFSAYRFDNNLTARFAIKNLLGTNVPRIGIVPDKPSQGGLGTEKRILYLTLAYAF